MTKTLKVQGNFDLLKGIRNACLTWSDSLVANFSEIEGFMIMREDLEK